MLIADGVRQLLRVRPHVGPADLGMREGVLDRRPQRALGERAELVTLAETSLRASVEHAFAHPEASRAYVRAHSQELSDAVCDQHIALYVNEFSIDLGDDGMRAVEALTARTSLPRS
ncbi:MAG: 1,4-dihydroxy-6-naphthoate synthase [Gaiellales bacterium]|nr:1,4-dihydroxy-6-naphthoate synthase [Gaiellales bacterium]